MSKTFLQIQEKTPNKIIQKEPLGPAKTGDVWTGGRAGLRETQVRHLRMIEVSRDRGK